MEEWRTSRAARYGGGVAVVAWSGIVAADILSTDGRSGTWIDWTVQTAAAAALWWLLAMRPMVRLGRGQVVVRNPLWTRRLLLADVADAVPGYLGVRITRHGRRLPVVAWAVQEANLSSLAERDTRAKKLSARLRELARPAAE